MAVFRPGKVRFAPGNESRETLRRSSAYTKPVMPDPRVLLFSALACCACGSSSPASPGTTQPPAGDAGPGSDREAAIDASASAADAGAANADGDGDGDDGHAGDDGGGQHAVTFDFDACAPNPSVGDFPTDVGGVIRAKCQACHSDPTRHGAPFPLVNYEGVVASLPGVQPPIPIWQEMAQVIQPGNVPHMPLSGPQLTDVELKT